MDNTAQALNPSINKWASELKKKFSEEEVKNK